MRFLFCGKETCPNWLLRELQELSLISAVRIRVITNEIIRAMLYSRRSKSTNDAVSEGIRDRKKRTDDEEGDDDFDVYDERENETINEELLESLAETSQARYTNGRGEIIRHGITVEDVYAAASCVKYILESFVRFDLTGDVMRSEIGQMGVPREHVEAIAKPYEVNKESLRARALKNVIRVGRRKSNDDCDGVECEWEIVAKAVDTTSAVKEEEDLIELRANVRICDAKFSVDEVDLRMVINEMKLARKAMEY